MFPHATDSQLFGAALVACALGGFGSALLQRSAPLANGVAFGFAFLASLCGVGASAYALSGAEPTRFELFSTDIPLLRVSVTVDAPSAFFLLMVSLLGLA